MEPLVYALPEYNQTIKSSDLNIIFDNHPSPKLIKYGFNNIANQLDMVALTSIPSYKAGLEFDFDRTEDNSFVAQAEKNFSVKEFDQTFGEFWEILLMFKLLNQDQIIYSPQNYRTVQSIVNSYQKITTNNFNIKIENTSKKTNAKLVIHKYSDIDLDENASVQFIIDILPDLLSVQSEGSNMILQLFNMQTQITSEIIYLLSNLYAEAYLFKPIIVSDLYDTKYIILINLKAKFNLVIPKHSENVYLSSLGFQNLPNNFETMIQCMNSDVMAKKFQRYAIIKSYLDTKVYEGATYQEMITQQKSNAKKWLEIFSNVSNLESILDDSLKRTSIKCNTHSQLISMFG
jgi:hypothetical protein